MGQYRNNLSVTLKKFNQKLCKEEEQCYLGLPEPISHWQEQTSYGIRGKFWDGQNISKYLEWRLWDCEKFMDV